MMNRRKIIIDTDPGIDDAFAIIAALSCSQFEVLGITVVGGNNQLNSCVNNALGLVSLMDSRCPVHAGAPASLNELRLGKTAVEHSTETHGKGGLGGVSLPVDPAGLSTVHAADFIAETVRSNPGEVEIVTLGPLTNIALAMERQPGLLQDVKCIWSMGGGVEKGNRTVVAEFNYWADPEAAARVFAQGQSTCLNMIGLDVTTKTSFSMNDLFFLKHEGGRLGKFFHDITEQYTRVYWERFRLCGCVIHDLVAMMIAIDPSLCGEGDVFPRVNVRIETEGMCRGQTLVDLHNHRDLRDLPKNASVYMGIDRNRYKLRFFETVFKDVSQLYEKHVLGT